MAEGITDLDMSSFDEAISASDKPVLVDFWAAVSYTHLTLPTKA